MIGIGAKRLPPLSRLVANTAFELPIGSIFLTKAAPDVLAQINHFAVTFDAFDLSRFVVFTVLVDHVTLQSRWCGEQRLPPVARIIADGALVLPLLCVLLSKAPPDVGVKSCIFVVTLGTFSFLLITCCRMIALGVVSQLAVSGKQ